MTLDQYEQIFRGHLVAQKNILLARSLASWARNEYVTQHAHSQWHDARHRLMAIEDRVIREVGKIDPMLEDKPLDDSSCHW